VVVDADVATAVGHGKVLDPSTLGVQGPGPWAVTDRDEALLAVYEAHGSRVKPSIVLVPAGTG
jgi:hypothetical protein